MRIVHGFLTLFSLTTIAMAQEPEDKFPSSFEFDVKGGRSRTWDMGNCLSRTDKTPVEIRFVVRGYHVDPRWEGVADYLKRDSYIGFFFHQGTSHVGDATPTENPEKEIQLRFVIEKLTRPTGSILGPASRIVLIPKLLEKRGRSEKVLATMHMLIRRKRPVTLLIRRDKGSKVALVINGREVPRHIDSTLSSLSVQMSGVEGEISMPPCYGTP